IGLITRGKVFTIVAFVWSLIPIPPPFNLAIDSLFIPMLVYVVAGRNYVLWYYVMGLVWSIPSIVQMMIYGTFASSFIMFYDQLIDLFVRFIPNFVAPTPFITFTTLFIFPPFYCVILYLVVRTTYRKAKKIYARVPSYRRS